MALAGCNLEVAFSFKRPPCFVQESAHQVMWHPSSPFVWALLFCRFGDSPFREALLMRAVLRHNRKITLKKTTGNQQNPGENQPSVFEKKDG